MSYKDTARKAQGQMNYPKLEIISKFEVKEDTTDNKAKFRYWNPDKEESVFTAKSIEGFLLGSANIMTCYDDELGHNGNSYFTSYYFTNKLVTLFNPYPTAKKIITGTMDEVLAHLATMGATGSPSKKKVLFVLTKSGIITVLTNMSIAIDQMKVDADYFIDYLIKLTPKKFDPSDKKISNKAKEFLGKFAKKNPPNYAEISQGALVSDELAEEWKIEENLLNFIAWKEFKMQGTDKVSEATTTTNESDVTLPPSETLPSRESQNNNIVEEESDLPF